MKLQGNKIFHKFAKFILKLTRFVASKKVLLYSYGKRGQNREKLSGSDVKFLKACSFREFIELKKCFFSGFPIQSSKLNSTTNIKVLGIDDVSFKY